MGFSREEYWIGVLLPSPSAYLRLLIFLSAILIPACTSSSPAFCMMYAAYKWQYTALTYSFPSLEAVCCYMCSSNCCFLTCIQVSQEASKVFWYSHLFNNFPQFVVIHTVKGIIIVNEAEIDVFLEFPSFFYDPINVGNLISGSFAFSKSSLYIWKFLVHVLLKPSLKDFEHYLSNIWNEWNCAVVWTFFDIVFLLDCNEN